MTSKAAGVLGRIGYGVVFVVALPALLIEWAGRTQPIVALPAIRSMALGGGLAAAGVGFMLLGTLALMRHGKGLPMNAFPPALYVSRGIYRVAAHPIYTGFILACAGVAIAAGSASGLWLVFPSVVLGCVALVLGYESRDLNERFPGSHPAPFLRMPAEDDGEPTSADRISASLFVAVSWTLLAATGRGIHAPEPPAVALTAPLLTSAWILYATAYLVIPGVPLVAGRNRQLRTFTLLSIATISVGAATLLLIPAKSGAVSTVPGSFPSWMFDWERCLLRNPAIPSPLVSLTVLAIPVWESRWPKLRWAWRVWATTIVGSAFVSGVVPADAVVTGLLVALLLTNIGRGWELLRRGTERLANSWHEARLGPVRFINHGLYAGAGSAVGICIVSGLAGAGSVGYVLLVAFSILLAAGAWAQWVEGSPSLLRPYGWYGGLFGTIAGCIFAGFLGADTWVLLGGFCVAAPWIQSLGRLRCLVQGCCHGSPAPSWIGIRYTHPRSRVTRLSKLGGTPVHPTPLYSILWNVVIAMIVARLWFLQTETSFICGVYLILMGLGRFVEESYRGEPQTPVRAGLRLYQWLAVGGIVSGIIITMIRGTTVPPTPEWQWSTLAGAVGFGLVATLALGADFPESNRRFARLA